MGPSKTTNASILCYSTILFTCMLHSFWILLLVLILKWNPDCRVFFPLNLANGTKWNMSQNAHIYLVFRLISFHFNLFSFILERIQERKMSNALGSKSLSQHHRIQFRWGKIKTELNLGKCLCVSVSLLSLCTYFDDFHSEFSQM